jgi:hypothetical protein
MPGRARENLIFTDFFLNCGAVWGKRLLAAWIRGICLRFVKFLGRGRGGRTLNIQHRTLNIEVEEEVSSFKFSVGSEERR